MRRWSLDHITQLICAVLSRRLKYQWPFRCRLKSLTSPLTQKWPNVSSTSSFVELLRSVMQMAVSREEPGGAWGNPNTGIDVAKSSAVRRGLMREPAMHGEHLVQRRDYAHRQSALRRAPCSKAASRLSSVRLRREPA